MPIMILHGPALDGRSAAYERVCELRVYLKRVANPRAIGMLRRWLTTASNRKAQILKLRRAYSLLANGTITRVTRAWRGLVARQHAVRERVSRLLGRMLDATFHGWVRIVRKRIAARAAGIAVHEARRARVHLELLRRWTYTAHLSSALADGLRNLFLRSAFSVFGAWATYARERAADRQALDALQEALDAGGEEAEATFASAVCRWRIWEVAAAYDMWAAHAHFASKAAMLTGLAVQHSSQACKLWAFVEYRFAVRIAIEERAAALFWSQGAVRFVFTRWKVNIVACSCAFSCTAAHMLVERTHDCTVLNLALSVCLTATQSDTLRARMASSKAATAVFHFCSRLEQLVLLRWRDAAREWRARRLGTLAARLHFEGTLSMRVFEAWRRISSYHAWQGRQVALGMIRHFTGLTTLVFTQWRIVTRATISLRILIDGRFADATRRAMAGAVEIWRTRAWETATVAMLVGDNRRVVILRHGLRVWLEFSELSAVLGNLGFTSEEHAVVKLMRKALRRWHAMSLALRVLGNVVDDLTHGRAVAALRSAVASWGATARYVSKALAAVSVAVDNWEENSTLGAFSKWRLRVGLGAQRAGNLRAAMHRFICRATVGSFERWRQRWAARLALIGAMRRSMAHWNGRLEIKVVVHWKVVLTWRARRQQVSEQCLHRLMHRALAMCWHSWLEFVGQRREVALAAARFYGRVCNRELVGAFVEWTAACRESLRVHTLSEATLEHLHNVAHRTLSVRLASWCAIARHGALMRLALGRLGRKEVAVALYQLWRHRSYCKLVLALMAGERIALAECLAEWAHTAFIHKTLDLMHGTNVARDIARRLRAWHQITSRRVSCDLRHRYMLARRAFYARQDILSHWRMQAAASQHCRRSTLGRVVRCFLAHSRGRMHLRRCYVRAFGLWATTLAARVYRAWWMHAETARIARIEIVRARANQTTLDAHRRRARARALAAIISAWHAYAHARATVHRIADATAEENRLRFGFRLWSFAAVLQSHRFVAHGMASAHSSASARRYAFGVWQASTAVAVRHAGVLLNLVHKRAHGTQLLVFRSWRILVMRNSRLSAIHYRMTGRLAAITFAGWARYTEVALAAQETVEERAVAKRRATLLLAMGRWSAHTSSTSSRDDATRQIVVRRLQGATSLAMQTWRKAARRAAVEAILGARTAARDRRTYLHTWRHQLMCERRQLRTATVHALTGRAGRAMRRLKRYLHERRTRRRRIMSDVNERILAREVGACGEVVRMWRAVTACGRRERRQKESTLGALRSLASVSVAKRSRLSSAFAYYCKRLAGLVFFHWRALSWSRNWEKPGRLSEVRPSRPTIHAAYNLHS